jgi:hypothetical protein
MSDLRKAAQQALEALEWALYYNKVWKCAAALEALRPALAQPDTEMPKTLCGPNLEEVLNAAGFYKREPLTEDEIDGMAINYDGLPNSFLELARAIEKAHGIS